MSTNKYKVTLPDVGSFELFSSLVAAMKYAHACKDHHGGASVYRLANLSYDSGTCMASWTRGADGRVRRVRP